MALPPKVCPSCAEEYVHSVSRCVHCDVDLVAADALPAAPPSDLPPASELTAIRFASAGWALALSERLVEEAIAHRVEPASGDAPEAGRAGPYGVYVRAEDEARARAIDAEQLGREIPDLPDDWEGAAAAAEGCPACGAAVPEGAGECPDCGLAL